MMRKVVLISCLVTTAIGFGFTIQNRSQNPIQNPQNTNNHNNSFFTRLADSAYTLTLQNVTYDPKYTVIPYPNGDVPKDKGVCTDVVIRAYRKLGIDLQKEVHQDMIKNFQLYPKYWSRSSSGGLPV